MPLRQPPHCPERHNEMFTNCLYLPILSLCVIISKWAFRRGVAWTKCSRVANEGGGAPSRGQGVLEALIQQARSSLSQRFLGSQHQAMAQELWARCFM